MRFRDFVVRDAIITDLRAATKDDAIRALVTSLADAGALPTPAAAGVASAILAREGIATTALGRGVAFPHARHAGVPGLVGAIAIDRVGIEYGALDDQKVHVLIAVVSPAAEAGRHLRVLEFLCAAVGGGPRMKDATGTATTTTTPGPQPFGGVHWLDRLRDAATRDEVVAVLDEVDRIYGTDR